MMPLLGVNIDALLVEFEEEWPEALAMLKTAGVDYLSVSFDLLRSFPEAPKTLRKTGLPVALDLPCSKGRLAPAQLKVVKRLKPQWVYLLPDRLSDSLVSAVKTLKRASIQVGCMIEPSLKSVRICQTIGADGVQFALTGKSFKETKQLLQAAAAAKELQMECHLFLDGPLDEIRKFSDPLFDRFESATEILRRAMWVGLERAVREASSLVKAP